MTGNISFSQIETLDMCRIYLTDVIWISLATSDNDYFGIVWGQDDDWE